MMRARNNGKAFFVILLFLSLMYSGSERSNALEQTHPMVGKKVPIITLQRHCIALDYKSVDLEKTMLNKTALIVFWSEHCLSCQDVLAFVDDLNEEYGDNLVLIGIDTACEHVFGNDYTEDWADMLCGEDSGFNQSYIDKDLKGSSLFHVLEIPTTFIIDSSGVITMAIESYFQGYRTKVIEELRRLVGE